MRKKCEICGLDFSYTTGKFTIHLSEEHNISLRDYGWIWVRNSDKFFKLFKKVALI